MRLLTRLAAAVVATALDARDSVMAEVAKLRAGTEREHVSLTSADTERADQEDERKAFGFGVRK